MFFPNDTCEYYARTGAGDNFGKFTFVSKGNVACSLIEYAVGVAKSPVRGDSSGSRGQAEQDQGVAKILFPRTATVSEGDVVYIESDWLEITSIFPRRDIFGKLDHFETALRKTRPAR